MQSVKKTHRKDSTKNEGSERAYNVCDEVMPCLKALKAKQDEYKLLFGDAYQDSDYVFRWPDGRLIRPDYITSKFQKILKKHNLKHIRLHDLRHSCATILATEHGFSMREIQEWCDWSGLEMLQTYIHVPDSSNKKMAKAMGKSFLAD